MKVSKDAIFIEVGILSEWFYSTKKKYSYSGWEFFESFLAFFLLYWMYISELYCILPQKEVPSFIKIFASYDVLPEDSLASDDCLKRYAYFIQFPK